MGLAIHHCQTTARNNKKPLVRSSMSIVRPAFDAATGKDHFSELAISIPQSNLEFIFQLQMRLLHSSIYHTDGAPQDICFR